MSSNESVALATVVYSCSECYKSPMAKREHARDALEQRLAAHVLAHGLGQTSLRQLAAAAGTSDRMLLYYFADKADLLGTVLARLAADMSAMLEAALPTGATLSAGALFRLTAQAALQPTLRPYMELWAEIAAEAGRGISPFKAIADAIAQGFQAWAEARLAEPDPQRRAELASLLIVAVDGAALLAPLDDGRITARATAALAALLD